MTLDLTTTAPCTQEDGSDAGQVFPCHWDAALMGNGQGVSFVMNAPQSWLYEDGTLICGPNLQANDAVDACEPITEPVSPANAPLEAAPATLTQTQVLASPPVSELAHTGPTDPILWVTGVVIVTFGWLCITASRRARRSS